MKVTQISEHIWSLKAWVLIPIHVWLVTDDNGITLVDTGIQTMSSGIRKAMRNLNGGELQQILLTHGHIDHTGSIKRILNEREVPVFAHPIEIPYMEGHQPYPGRNKPAVTVQSGIATALPEDDQGNLISIAGLKPYHTPGHSPGHVVYYHEQDDVLLAGDLFTSKKGRLHRPMPMFTANMEEAINSAKIVRKLKPQRLEIAHGNPVFQPADHLDEYITKNLKIYENKNEQQANF